MSDILTHIDAGVMTITFNRLDKKNSINSTMYAAMADAVAQAGMVNKGDTTWMLVSSALVLLMAIPALGLFYGGLVRSKNMLSVLMQTFMIVCLVAVLWVTFGYSLAFTSGF